MLDALLLASSRFHTIDLVIIAAYLIGTTVVGFLANRYIRDMSDYIVAGRSLGSSLGVATMLGSEIGLVTVMYAAQKGFTTGFAAFHIGLMAGIGCLFIGLTGMIVTPLRRAGVKTIPEFYGQRFSRGVRIFGGIMMAAAGILNMGAFLKTGALFISGLFGYEDAWTVNWIMAGLLGLVLLYTTLGGMVSVVITDYFQFVVLSVGLVVCCMLAVNHLSWPTVVETVNGFHGEDAVSPLANKDFGLPYVIWSLFVFGIVSCAVWPTAVMRACSMENEASVKTLYQWSAIGFVTRVVLPQFLGICALAYFITNPDLGARFFTDASTITNDGDITLTATPAFLSQILPIGVLGLVAAGMLAAFMSTNDSYLLCWAAVIVEDIVDPILGNRLSVVTKLWLARGFIVLIGVYLFVFGLLYPMRQDLVDYLAVSGAIYSTGAFTVLMLGLYWKPASSAGAYAALAVGSLAIFGLESVQSSIFFWPEQVGAAEVGLFVTFLALLSMVFFSYVFPDKRQLKNAADMVSEDEQLSSWKDYKK